MTEIFQIGKPEVDVHVHPTRLIGRKIRDHHLHSLVQEEAKQNHDSTFESHVSVNVNSLAGRNFEESRIEGLTSNVADETSSPGKEYNFFVKHKKRYKKFVKNQIARHAKMYTIWYSIVYNLFYKRCFVLWDMYTDIVIAYQLYLSNEIIWFALSSLFIATPFMINWVMSLRIVDKEIINNGIITNKYISRIVKFLIPLYLFPIFGATMLFIIEIVLVFYDIIGAFVSLFKGTSFETGFQSKYEKYISFKYYRKQIETFGESLPQVLLQLYIFIVINYSNYNNNSNASDTRNTIDIKMFDLVLSLITGVIHLSLNFYSFYSESKHHGIKWYEYALSILQLSQIPLQPFVPQIGVIKNGKIDQVNWSHFKLENESLIPILNAFSDKKCKVEKIKLSLYSLSKLNFDTAKAFGTMIKDKNVKLIISDSVNAKQVKKLFYKCQNGDDLSNNSDENISLNLEAESNRSLSKRIARIFSIADRNRNYLTKNAFVNNVHLVNPYFKHLSQEKKEEMFACLAIRDSDKIYFWDFFNSILSMDTSVNYKINLTQMFDPIHACFYCIDKILQNINDSITKTSVNIGIDIDDIVHGLRNVVHVCHRAGLHVVAVCLHKILCTLRTKNGNSYFFKLDYRVKFICVIWF